jgi:hypothetical protein
MKESLGNEYQEMFVNSVFISLVATQATVESDSYDDQYDAAAATVMPVIEDPIYISKTISYTTNTGSGDLAEKTVNAAISDSTIDAGNGENAKIEIPAGSFEVTDSNSSGVVFTVSTTNVQANSTSYEINLTDTNGNSLNLKNKVKITLPLSTGLDNVSVTHNGNPMDAGDYTYNSTTGLLVIETASFSPFVVSYTFDPVVTLNDVGYMSINAAINAANSGDTIYVQKDVSGSYAIISLFDDKTRDSKTITVDLCGHTIERLSDTPQVVQVSNNEDSLIVKNGTIKSTGTGVFSDADTNITLNNVVLNTEGTAIINKSNALLEKVTINSKARGMSAYGGNVSVNESIIKSKKIGIYMSGESLSVVKSTISSEDRGINNVGKSVSLKDSTINSGDIGIGDFGTDSTVEITSSTINSNYFGVYHNGSTAPCTVTIKDSTITDTHAQGVYISNSAGRDLQTVSIDNSTITGPTAVEVKHTNLTITDSTLIASKNPPSVETNNNGSCSAGYPLAITTNSSDDYVTGKVEVSNCTLQNPDTKSDAACFVFKVKEGAGNSVTINEVSYEGSEAYSTEEVANKDGE